MIYLKGKVLWIAVLALVLIACAGIYVGFFAESGPSKAVIERLLAEKLDSWSVKLVDTDLISVKPWGSSYSVKVEYTLEKVANSALSYYAGVKIGDTRTIQETFFFRKEDGKWRIVLIP